MIRDVAGAVLCAVLFGGPFALYFMFVMTP
jgi:hypothetical protein